jgi:hypothetical protein
VLNLFETHPIELYHLTIVTADGRRERLGTTGNHPFYEASERRFVPARELRPGCRVVTVTGAIAEVEAVEVHTAAAGESFTTYNIEVEEDHTYHVGELGTWVHNESAERCLKLAREAANGSEEAVAELRRIFSKAPDLRRSVDGSLKEIVDQDILRRIDSQDFLPKGFDPTDGFQTFNDFKDAFGAAGKGLAWHHIVEQAVNSGRFAREILHNPANLFRLPHGKGSIHAKISGYYSSKKSWTGGVTVRQWIARKSFKEQFEFGIETIKQFGGTKYLPIELR